VSLHLVAADVIDLHEIRDGCPCGPLVEVRPRPDGTYGRVVDHRGPHMVEETPEVEE
jgi:hypothetical protein